MNSNWSSSQETPNLGQIQRFLEPSDLFDGWHWWMTLKNNRAPLLFYFKLCGSFCSHWWIQTGVTVWNPQTGSNSAIFLSRVTLKFDGWPWKTIGHLFHVASSFVHHFIAIGGFKLKLQSGNAQFGSKLAIFFTVWPWNLTNALEKQ